MKPRIREAWVGAALLTGLVALPACRTSMNTVERAQPEAQRQMVDDKRVITDAGLNRKVRILSVNQATGPGGFVKIQVDVQNLMRSRQFFSYRIEWFDENGMIVSTPTGNALPKSIESKETISITATAPTDKAKDFRIKFLEPTN